MNRFKQVVLNSLPLGSSRPAVSEERVLDLFRNRVELKKDYLALQSELQNCKDRLKQQEGTLARAQESMAALEARLTRPDSGAAAMVYFQLRDLWSFAQQLLEQFVEERRVQRESLEKAQFERGAQLESIRRMAAVDAALNLASATAASARARTQEYEQQLQRSRSWWQYFKRRSLRHLLQIAVGHSAVADMELNTIVAEREALAAAGGPEFPGLSLVARRNINHLVVAYADVLHARLAGSPVVDSATKAVKLREPPESDYGDFNACRQMMKEIQRARLLLEQRETLREELQAVQVRLASHCRFVADDSSLPDADTLLGSTQLPGSRVLKDNLWQINRLLLR